MKIQKTEDYLNFSNTHEVIDYMNRVSDHLIFELKEDKKLGTSTTFVSNFKYNKILKKVFKEAFRIDLKDTKNVFAYNYKKSLSIQQWTARGSFETVNVKTHKILEKIVKNLNQIDNDFEKNIKKYKIEIQNEDNYSLKDYNEHEIVTYIYEWEHENSYKLSSYFQIQTTKPKKDIDDWSRFHVYFKKKK